MWRAGENNVNGFGLEFFIETPAEEIGSSLTDIKKSWQFQLLYTVSQLAAGAARVVWLQQPFFPAFLPSQPTMPRLLPLRLTQATG